MNSFVDPRFSLPASAVLSRYVIGKDYLPPLLPFRMTVVDVSMCGRFVTFAREHESGKVVEYTLTVPESGSPNQAGWNLQDR